MGVAQCYSLQEAVVDQLFQSSEHSSDDLLWLAQSIFSSLKDVITVSLDSSRIPIVQLAEGLLISYDPLCEIDGVPIGPEYCKVFVLKVKKPNTLLETTSRGLRTVGETVGRYIVWRSIHVYVTILFIC
ncbi:unnamed protein product [Camellia sinensis]